MSILRKKLTLSHFLVVTEQCSISQVYLESPFKLLDFWRAQVYGLNYNHKFLEATWNGVNYVVCS
jgi:hypothetical protein